MLGEPVPVALRESLPELAEPREMREDDEGDKDREVRGEAGERRRSEMIVKALRGDALGTSCRQAGGLESLLDLGERQLLYLPQGEVVWQWSQCRSSPSHSVRAPLS